MIKQLLSRTIDEYRFNESLDKVSIKLSELDEGYADILCRIDLASNREDFSRDIREYYKSMKWSLEILDYLLPLYFVTLKIVARHGKEIYFSSNSVELPEQVAPPISFNTLFEELTTWDYGESIDCLKYMNLPQNEWDMLVDAFETQDKAKFQNVLYNTSADIKVYRQKMGIYVNFHPLLRECIAIGHNTLESPYANELVEQVNAFCQISKDDDTKQKVQKYLRGYKTFMNMLYDREEISFAKKDLELFSDFVCQVVKVIPISLIPENEESISTLEKFFDGNIHRRTAIRICKNLLCCGYSLMAENIHSLLDDCITTEETEHIDRILENISCEDYRLLMYGYRRSERLRKSEAGTSKEIENQTNWFPDNFIQLERDLKFGSIDETMLADNGIHFRDFVDDIARRGWIDNTKESKLRFTYCLTSRICCNCPEASHKQQWYGKLKHLYWMFINFSPERSQRMNIARKYFCDPKNNELQKMDSTTVSNVRTDNILRELISKYFPVLFSNHYPKRTDK